MNLKLALRCICEALSGQVQDDAIELAFEEIKGVNQLVIYSNFIKSQVKKLIKDEMNLNFDCFKNDHAEKMTTPAVKYLESEIKFTNFMIAKIEQVGEGTHVFTNLNASTLKYKGLPLNEVIYDELEGDTPLGLYEGYEEMFEENI